MPVWHEKTRQARRAGKLVVIGLIQEQHADRCRLFAQWKGFDWPILHDPINRLGPRAVPIVVAVDEAGNVVDASLSTDELASFLQRAPAKAAASIPSEISEGRIVDQQAKTSGRAIDWILAGDRQLLWGRTGKESEAINRYQKAVELDQDSAPGWFRLGAAFRARFDSPQSRRDDFANAVAAWERALEIDPNHYIYRRRIQQYGPRLSKPYPFYDWIDQARREIEARGDKPVTLRTEPVGAEIAEPSPTVQASVSNPSPPDPQGRISRDRQGLVQVDVVVVPGKVDVGDAVRVHLHFQPTTGAHWNNEVEPPKVWIETPKGWQVESPLLELPQPLEPESSEPRVVDFEVRTAEPAAKNTVIHAYTFDVFCEEEGGQCHYRRQDIDIPIRVNP